MKIKIEKPWSDALKIIGITVAVYCGMRYILPIVFPFFLAILLAILLRPVIVKIEKKIKIPRGLLSFLVLMAALLVVAIPVCWIAWKLLKQACGFLSEYHLWKGEVDKIWCCGCERMESFSGIKAEIIQDWGNGQADRMGKVVEEKLLPFLMNCSVNGLKGLAAFSWKLIVTMVATVLILTDYENLKEKFMRTSAGQMIEEIGKNTLHVSGKFIKAQLIILSIVCCICVAGLFVAGNNYALLAGIGIGICDALPFLGTGTIFVPWLILCLFQGKYLLSVLYGALYIISTLVREFLEPKLVGKGAGAHPLAVIFSIYIGIYAYGSAGVILGPLSVLLICELYKMNSSNC